MQKVYKFRVYPTQIQKKTIEDQLEICREIYNKTLKYKTDLYDKTKKSIGLFDLRKELTQWKKSDDRYKSVHSQVLQALQERVDLAFQGFFRRLRAAKPGESFGFPKEKAEGRMRSLTYPQSGFKFFSKSVELSKIGKIRTVFHRSIEGKVCRLSLVKYPSGKFFICVTAEITANTPKIDLAKPAKAVGIDLGVSHFAVLSDGVVEDSPGPLRESKIKLARQQSKGKSVVFLHEKIANRRSDFLHKLANKIVQRYDIICVENLNVKSMQSKTNGFSRDFRRAIADNGWSIFINLLQYKAVMAGKKVVLVDPKFTSQTCSKCLTRKQIPLSERSYFCEACGLLIDRDLNASYNILRIGLADSLAGNTA